jgi:hypothetical protein
MQAIRSWILSDADRFQLDTNKKLISIMEHRVYQLENK